MNGYDLSRKWFDFAFENPEKINTNHTALFFYIVDRWNRFGQKEKFSLPSLYTMEALCIRSRNTYYSVFNDLVSFGFIEIVQKSQNQNMACVISLAQKMVKRESSEGTAHDQAMIWHDSKRRDGTVSSGGNIDKQINKETIKQENNETISSKEEEQSSKKNIRGVMIDENTIYFVNDPANPLLPLPEKKEEKEKSSAKKEKEEYGDPELNRFLSVWRECTGMPLGGDTGQKTRYAAKHFYNDLKKAYPDYDPCNTAKAILIAGKASKNDFHRSILNNVHLLRKHWQGIVSVQQKKQEQEYSHVVA